MEEVKYIPGDLVMTNGVPLGTAKDVVYRVTSSDPSKTLELDDRTVLKGVVRLDNLEGAKLVIGMLTSKMQEDKVDAELPNIDALIKESTSDEFIKKKINDVLGDDVELKEE